MLEQFIFGEILITPFSPFTKMFYDILLCNVVFAIERFFFSNYYKQHILVCIAIAITITQILVLYTYFGRRYQGEGNFFLHYDLES
jgi:hypothetical protein